MPKLTAHFVVLTHNFPELHWDFMLEKEASLRTWRLSAPPDHGGDIVAMRLPDHRLAYLDYEGPVSGNRGEVRQWDRGDYELINETEDQIQVRLTGQCLQGIAVLRSGDSTEEWEFCFTAADS